MNNIITEANCVDHYRSDLRVFKNQLKKYPSDGDVYRTLIVHFVLFLLEKYETFIEDLVEGMPENDFDIMNDLEN